MSLLECIVFPLGQNLIPLKVTFQGKTGHEKSKLALCLWVFSHIGLMYHFLICQLTYLRADIIIKLSDVYSLRQQSREICHRKNWLKYYHEYM